MVAETAQSANKFDSDNNNDKPDHDNGDEPKPEEAPITVNGS